MKVQEFVEYLNRHNTEFEYAEAEYNGKDGIMVKNTKFETETHITTDAIKSNNLDVLVTMTTHGKNVEHVTRVTGFFSKVEGWNKGKRGELKTRHRSDV